MEDYILALKDRIIRHNEIETRIDTIRNTFRKAYKCIRLVYLVDSWKYL